jgi:hypothetical protein
MGFIRHFRGPQPSMVFSDEVRSTDTFRDDDPIVAGENASDLALVPLCQEFDAHSGIITNGLFGSGYAGLGSSARRGLAVGRRVRAGE